MSLRTRRAGIAALAGVGLWQLVAGVYIHAKALLAQQLIASAWSQTLAGAREVLPWPWADTWPVARLRVADDVDLYVLADASGRSLAFGPGHVSGSAAVGSEGHTLLAAHRDTHFRFLRNAKPGMLLSLQTADGRETLYRTAESHIIDVRSERLALADAPATLTLMTCYPFDAVMPGGPLRYAVVAERIHQAAAPITITPAVQQQGGAANRGFARLPMRTLPTTANSSIRGSDSS